MHLINSSVKKDEADFDNDFWFAHRRLAAFNKTRLNPKIPSDNWRQQVQRDYEFVLLENEILEIERRIISSRAQSAPQNAEDFIKWFEDLKATGPGQNSPLFDWLADCASAEEMKWFIKQEVAGEAGFEDLTALAQLKVSTRAKLEMARNYWDEMGKGKEAGMHGPMLTEVAKEFNVTENNHDDIVVESLALGNVLLGMAMNRNYAFHAIGALGVVELTAPGRAKKVSEGLKRLGVSPKAQRYYLLHSVLDIKHSEDWNREVLIPLVKEQPTCAVALAEGALMRLNAGSRCFRKYQRHLWKNDRQNPPNIT